MVNILYVVSGPLGSIPSEANHRASPGEGGERNGTDRMCDIFLALQVFHRLRTGRKIKTVGKFPSFSNATHCYIQGKNE